MPPPDPLPPRRAHALDAFRGLVIVLMFLVNTAGRDPAFPAWFPHRGWDEGRMGNGLADFVFPWFLFVVGVAIPISMSSGRGKGRSPLARVAVAFRRAVTIYLLGTLLWCATIAYAPQTPITWSVLLHWDILPLIAIAYFIAVVLEFGSIWAHVAFVLAALVWKWLSLTQIPHPDVARVVWEERQNFDQVVKARFGWFGVLLTQGLAACAITSLGAIAGRVLHIAPALASNPAPPNPSLPAAPNRALPLALAGLACALLGSLWHLSGNLPMSKDFLTSSYVLYMSGTAALVLALFHVVIDVRGWTRATPLRVFGLNAIALYIAAEFLWKTVLMKWHVATPGGGASVAFVAAKAWCQHALGPANGSWAVVAAYILAYGLFAYVLYRKKWFIKV